MPSPSLATIAAKAGVSVSAVSLALRNSSRVSDVTKVRIRGAAEQLGYAPSPLMSAFMSRLRRVSGSEARETIAYLCPSGADRIYWSSLYFQEIERSAKAKAEALQMRLERLPLPGPEVSSKRLDQILRNRGINAVIIAPLSRLDRRLDLDWSRYSVVAVGHTLREPALHRVAPDQFQGMMLVMRELAARGYRRIGLYLDREADQRTDQRFSAAYRWQSAQSGRGRPIPILTFSEPDEEGFLAWVGRHSPDAIVTSAPVLRWLRGAGYKSPGQIGLVHLTWSDRPYPCAGLDQVPAALGAGAVETIVAMLTLNERGLPERPRTLTYGCLWQNGSTVRPRSTGPAS